MLLVVPLRQFRALLVEKDEERGRGRRIKEGKREIQRGSRVDRRVSGERVQRNLAVGQTVE